MTNAQFLNENFGTNYNGWMRCSWKYDYKMLVWMVSIDGKVRKGWENVIRDENTVDEIYVWGLDEQPEIYKTVEEPYRLVVDKHQDYKVLGVYEYDALNSDEKSHRIWKKVANSLTEFYNK